MSLPAPLRGIRAAVIFLTRVPVGGFPYGEEDLRWSSAWFPLVGALLGAAMAGVFLLAQRAGPLPAAALAVAIGMLLTGAFHEDGLADTADALGGAFDREKLFLILKDSRIGSFGGAALCIVLVLRVTLLGSLGAAAPLALILTQSLARVPPLWLMGAMPYVTQDGAAKSRTIARATGAQVTVATLTGSALLAALVWRGLVTVPEAAALFAAAAFCCVLCGYRFHVRAGGLTGDFLGATEQVCEVALLLVLAVSRGGP